MKRTSKGGRSSPSKGSRSKPKRNAKTQKEEEIYFEPEVPEPLLSSMRSAVKPSESSPSRGLYTSFIDRIKDDHSTSAATTPAQCEVTSPTSPKSPFGSPLSKGSKGRNIVIPYVDGTSMIQTNSPKKLRQSSPQQRQKQQQQEHEERKLMTPRPQVVTRKDAINRFELLLNDRGISIEPKVGVFVGDDELDIDSFKNYLPLHAYDDTCLELVHTIDLQFPIQGKVLVQPRDPASSPSWLFCVVWKYDGEDKDTFTVFVKPESQQKQDYVANDTHSEADDDFAYAFAGNNNEQEEKEPVDMNSNEASEDLEGERIDNVPRINLLLTDHDDPWTFADRVAQAHVRRRKAEALLRYQLYIDCMPTDDVPPIDVDTLERIFQLAVGLKISTVGLSQTSSTLDLKSNLETAHLEKEVQLEYSRAMNGIIFDLKLRESSEDSMRFLNLDLPENNKRIPAPDRGTIPMVPFDWNLIRKRMNGRSFVANPHVLQAVIEVNRQCIDVREVNMFDTSIKNTITVQEFERLQCGAIDRTADHLREKWTLAIKSSVKEALAGTSQTWNLEQRDRKLYENGPLERFFGMVNQVMADALRDLTDANVVAFSDLMRHACSCTVQVISCSEVHTRASNTIRDSACSNENTSDEPSNESGDNDEEFRSLFCVKLTIQDFDPSSVPDVISTGETKADNDDEETEVPVAKKLPLKQFVYDVDISYLAKLPSSLLHRMLASLDNIIQIQRLAMDRLYWSSVPKIKCVGKEEPHVIRAEEIMTAQIDKSFPPLTEYLKTFDPYLEFVSLDVEALLKEQNEKYQEIKVQQPKKKKIKKKVDGLNEGGGTIEGANESESVSGDGNEVNIVDGPQAGSLAANSQDGESSVAAGGTEKGHSAEGMNVDAEKEDDEDDEGEEDDDEENGEGTKEPLDPVRLAAMVDEHLEAIRMVATNVPDTIAVGPFVVDCRSVKAEISTKHQNIADRLLDFVAKRTSSHATFVQQRFQDIKMDLSRFPQNIEDLVEIKNCITLVPKRIHELQQDVDMLWGSFDMLDNFGYKQTDEDFNTKWKVYGSPKQIADKVDATDAILEKEKVRYAAMQKEKQEDFVSQLDKLESEVGTMNQHSDLKRIEYIATRVADISARIVQAQEEAMLFNSRETLFAEENTDYEQVNEIARAFAPYQSLWETVNSWCTNEAIWRDGAFNELRPAEVEKEVTEAYKVLNRSVKFFEKSGLTDIKATAELIKDRVEAFRPSLPIIASLRNQGMHDRHWKELSKQIGVPLVPDARFTLNKALALGIDKHEELITKVAGGAAKEFQIEQALNKMAGEWENVDLECGLYKNTGTYVLHGIDEVMSILDEHITMTQAMQFSPFKQPFVERIDVFDHKLAVMSEVIEEWIAVQRNWLYLQPIFDSPDINKQLPAEGKRFSNVDKMWRQTLSGAKANPKAITFCSNEKLLEKFRESNMLLDMVSKGLSDYLETKRSGFSRFYFLSNDELLEILSETKDPAMVQPHLKKCFEGIKSVTFDDDQLITHMKSAEGEIVAVDVPVDPKGENVENWMTALEEGMKDSVKKVMYKSILDYVLMKRTEWIQVVPGQCALNGSQLHWTREIEEAMDECGNVGVGKCFEQQVQQINDMVALVRDPNLKAMARMTVSALTVIDVHARDVVEKLFQKGVSNKEEFLWFSQMRYYWEDGEALEGNLKVMMVSSKRPYGYEYLGNSFRLVITPLTDKCYLTLMGALQMTLGGAPSGPAGTGKTETCKDLAKALAKQCVVFNCSDGLDYLAMGKFFKGLASCGAWACFDEFNRIDIEVLSVVAQQIMTLQGGVLAGLTRIQFEGTEIRLSDQFAVFITMNPGYAGRTELPDNLKARFRPVAMMVPDYALIGEIMLYSFGYEKARICAKKMVATFTLCSEQLSAQSHYDYGMRAVKTVIVAAGNLRRDNPDEDEEILLLRALQDVNLPKFLAHDLPLFKGILSDLFPGKSRPIIDYGQLTDCLRICNEQRGLQSKLWFIDKQVQLYETIVVRHGLMLVGPTGGGKSSNLEGLTMTLSMLKQRGVKGYAFEKVHRHTVNPKAITMGQLYGQFDPNTHEWQDGILANLVRTCAKSTSTDRKWIVFDGPVDAIWIENMNTVLDDNKKLCLNSGEIMSLSEEMSMIFEVEDLEVASPATVSRVGIVYMEPAALGLDTIIQTWIDALPVCLTPQHRTDFQKLFSSYVDKGVQFLRRNLIEPVPTVNNNIVASLMRLLNCYLAEMRELEANAEAVPETLLESFSTDLEPLFIFSFVWSVCCTVSTAGRKRFDAWLRAAMSQYSCPSPFPKKGLVYDYTWNTANKKWVGWMDTIVPFQYDKSLSFAETIVPTQDSVCYTYLFDTLVRNHTHVLMTGPTGTGKTININRHLSIGLPAEFIPLNLTFSAQTSANQTQDLIDSKMEKRKKGVFGPPSGKQFVIFVDDFNMPQREEYGAQPPVEIIRQWFTYDGWYDRKTLTFRNIIDIVMVAAMGPPGGGRNPVTARVLRHYNIIGYTPLEASSMKTIFGTILGNFLSDGFGAALEKMADPLVEATIDIYHTICRELLPTPAKSHYTYNMRDLGKVFQGMLMVNNKNVTNASGLIKLWVHENRRVFKDRLVNEEDRIWFDDYVGVMVTEKLERDWAEINNNEQYLVFGDLIDPQEKNYCHVESMDELLTAMVGFLQEYNAESKTPMNLKLFMDALEHISRIARVLRQPMGNALLLGVGGSGRKSLSRLATYIADYDLFMVEISKGYGLSEWRDDLKGCLLKAGAEEKQVVFLFDDTQIIMDQMLEDINGILNAGDVPNIYAPEDMEAIMTSCRSECTKRKIPPTKLNIFGQYLNRVRQNTHMVICMGPGTQVFRDRLRMFPALVNCCTIDWFSEWPDEALKSVGMGIMQEVDLKLGNSLNDVVELFKVFHQSVATASSDYFSALRRYNYVTPTSYLELLNTFKSMLQEKRSEVELKRSRLQVGLDKMISTASQVADLQVQLRDMQPVLAQTQKDVEEMIVQITKDKAAADLTKAVVSKEEEAAQIKAKDTQAIADDAQRDLDEALPALDEAVKCLNLLKKADLDEVRSLKTPPSGVKLTMEAACIMFQVKGEMKGEVGNKKMDYWDASKKQLLSDPKMLSRLFTFDKDNIPEKVIAKMHVYIDNPDFTPQMIEKASKACTAICMWSRAMYKYHHVAAGVEPKRQKLAAAQAELDVTMGKLQKARDELQGVMDRINELEAGYNTSLEKKESLAQEVEQCSARLERAQKLIGGLGGEKDRWTQSVVQYGVDYVNVLGDVLIASGSIAYLGPFTSEFRQRLVVGWQTRLEELAIPHTPHCNLVTTLGNPVTIRSWQIAGLPADNHSTENAIVMAKARRWPLLIDPQTQANRYVKNMGKDSENGIEVTKPSNKSFIRTLENGVRFGKWVLLENISEKLDAALEPVLLQQTFLQDGQTMIRLGDNTVPYSENFRFFMTTKLPNPHYPPEVAVKVSLLNFSITPQGLEEQLLGLIMANELPEQEERKNELVRDNASMAKELQDIEEKILYMLSNSTGNILDDAELIETLANSKKTSQEINVKVVEAKETEFEIDNQRELYRSFAYRGSILFFCITELRVIDPMYEYSLQWFNSLFVQSILDSQPAPDVEKRLDILKEFFTYSLYNNVCRSLFEMHKLLFSFSMCVKILQGDDQIDAEEWRFLIAGQAGKPAEVARPDGESDSWITDKMWSEICVLSSLSGIDGFADDFANELTGWRALFDSETCFKDPLPGKWDSLSHLQKMIILRALRPDRMTEAVQNFVIHSFGQKFIEPPPFDMKMSYSASRITTPLIFLLTAGSDPTDDFFKFSETQGMDSKTTAISLGQGQGPIAAKMVEEAIVNGSWVLLQNCHLCSSWMDDLELIVEEIDPDTTHADFRLWLTSMPTKIFPVSVLQNGVKITKEPPKGMRANLKSAYYKLTDEQLRVSPRVVEFNKLLFGLCFFHALIQERRKFGALGWNNPYEFNDTDLDISTKQLQMYLDAYDEVPYDVLNFLTSYINYGGRVTDAIDLRVIDVILKDFYAPSVLEDGHAFSESGIYVSCAVNEDAPQKAYLEYIDSLPVNAEPEVFGLHSNANITCALEETYEMFDLLVALQPRLSTGGGKTREESIGDDALAIQELLPPEFDMASVSLQYPVQYGESMNTVLVQECTRYQNLLREIVQTLSDLQKALRGMVVMSSQLEEMGTSIYSQKVPVLWENKAYPSLKPLKAWVQEFLDRLTFLNTWVAQGKPKVYWISGFFFPQAFLTGTLQNFARKYVLPIDSVAYDYKVLDIPANDVSEAPEDGCYVDGLFLEGARWSQEEGSLVASRPKELFTEMPIMHFMPVENRQVPAEGFYRCPVYKVLSRRGTLSTTGHSTNFVLWVEVPSTGKEIVNNLGLPDKDRWIKAGVAAFCSLKY